MWVTWGQQGGALTLLLFHPPPPSPSVARSLGAKTVAARTLECAKECEILSEVVEDQDALRAVQRFLGERGLAFCPLNRVLGARDWAGWVEVMSRGHVRRTSQQLQDLCTRPSHIPVSGCPSWPYPLLLVHVIAKLSVMVPPPGSHPDISPHHHTNQRLPMH